MNQCFREIQTRLAEKRVSIVSKREYLGGFSHRPRIDVLRALEVEPRGLSLAKIVQRVGLPRSTVHLIVTALEAESSVVPASPRGGYRLGSELAWFAVSAGGELRESLRPSIERLRYEADETVNLAVLNRDRVFYIAQVTAPHRLQALSAVGASLPAHCTAIGRALLAGLTDEQVERLLPKRLPAETANTITDRDELLADLARVRVSGVDYDREELMIGISAVGAERRDASGVVAALSIPVPTARFGSQEERIAENAA